jgi:Zn ribbon nucleic-acid-binding protein
MSRKRYVKSASDITKCICPRCNEIHTMQIFWTGRGMPKKFCPACKDYSNTLVVNDFNRVSLRQKSVMQTEAITWL